VIHRHQLGNQTLRRVSELVFLRGEAKAVLEWIDSGGLRTPIYVDMDREKLRLTRGIRTLYYYDGTTVDPRLVELTASPEQRKPR
jgi:hypothetical protein